jgi:hypothetical protein
MSDHYMKYLPIIFILSVCALLTMRTDAETWAPLERSEPPAQGFDQSSLLNQYHHLLSRLPNMYVRRDIFKQLKRTSMLALGEKVVEGSS